MRIGICDDSWEDAQLIENTCKETYDLSTGKYLLRFTYYDIFGLDSTDIEERGNIVAFCLSNGS